MCTFACAPVFVCGAYVKQNHVGGHWTTRESINRKGECNSNNWNVGYEEGVNNNKTEKKDTEENN